MLARVSRRYLGGQREKDMIVKQMKGLEEQLSVLSGKLQALEDAKEDIPQVTIFGAGLSSTVLIEYLGKLSNERKMRIFVGDHDISVAERKCAPFKSMIPFGFDINGNQAVVDEKIKESQVVVSMVPARYHPIIADKCLHFDSHLVTASYTPEEIRAMDSQAREKGLMFLMECGVDPGIDHMATMAVLDRLKGGQNKLLGFETFTGGLVAPESDDNPWGYKFTWNPRNVVLAGQGISTFIQNGTLKFIPYHKLFSRIETLDIPPLGKFEGYANRDSLKYRPLYNIEDCPTVFRGTLRREGYCAAWDIFVQLGLTDDSYIIPGSEHMTYRQFINSFLLYRPTDSVELKLAYLLQMSIDSPEMEKLKWLGLFEERRIGLRDASPAQILQQLLEEKWKLNENDKDMIVMFHKYVYETPAGERKDYRTSMVLKGDNTTHTAMAKTVGLPVAMYVKRILAGEILKPGVHQPITRDLYEPVLEELATDYGVRFSEISGAAAPSMIQYN